MEILPAYCHAEQYPTAIKRYEKLYHDPIIFTDTPLGIYPMKATPQQYTRVMNDMQARKQVRHNRDNHNER